MKLLIVEDNKEIAEVIFDFFEGSEYELDYAVTGIQALSLARNSHFDCIVLDIMLPGKSGLEVCQELRQEGNNTPIIMLTARDTDNDMLKGFSTGADDYIVKPFNLELLEARVVALTRRHSGSGFKTKVSFGALVLDTSTYQVWRDNTEIKLTPTCFKILKLLADKSPKVTTREEVERLLWPDEAPDGDVLRKHIYQLRTKLDKPFSHSILETIPKIGYRLTNEK